jgi:hypothetical protein
MKESVFGFLVVLGLFVGAGAAYQALAVRAASNPRPPQGFEVTPFAPARFEPVQPLFDPQRGSPGLPAPSR